MIVGFTGTLAGMSASQLAQLRVVLTWLRAALTRNGNGPELHHGDARGADRQCAHVAKQLGGFYVTAWPPQSGDTSPLVRNRRDIVAPADVLIAAPKTDIEILRSGTWATVRAARRKGIPVIVLSRGANV